MADATMMSLAACGQRPGYHGASFIADEVIPSLARPGAPMAPCLHLQGSTGQQHLCSPGERVAAGQTAAGAHTADFDPPASSDHKSELWECPVRPIAPCP